MAGETDEAWNFWESQLRRQPTVAERDIASFTYRSVYIPLKQQIKKLSQEASDLHRELQALKRENTSIPPNPHPVKPPPDMPEPKVVDLGPATLSADVKWIPVVGADESAWQKIETAPKDMLIVARNDHLFIMICQWFSTVNAKGETVGGFWAPCGTDRAFIPTKWLLAIEPL